MEITISITEPTDQRSRVLAIESAVKTVCERASIDPAERPMLLLIAAVHMATKGAREPLNIVLEQMAVRLGEAIIEADDLFGVSRNPH